MKMPPLPGKGKPSTMGPDDLATAAQAALTTIDQIIDESDASDADKAATKRQVRHAVSRRHEQMVDDVNSLQHQTRWAVPGKVGPQLEEALQTQVVDYYDANRDAFVERIAKAFVGIKKDKDVKQALEKELIAKEKQLLKQATEGAKTYVHNMNLHQIADSHNELHMNVPVTPESPSSVLMNAMGHWRRFRHKAYAKKDWQKDITEEQNREKSDLELELGRAAISREYFALQSKKPEGAAPPVVNRKVADTIFNVLTGDLVSATGAEGTFGKNAARIATWLNPIYGARILFWNVLTGDMDKSRWCYEARYEENKQTGATDIIMPKYYTQWPFNAWPYNYEEKAYKRLIQSKAAVGEVPVSFEQFPPKYKKRLVMWGIADGLFTAENIGLAKEHPWYALAEKARIARSEQLGRAESIDYNIQRPDDVCDDIPELTSAKAEATPAVDIKASTPPTPGVNLQARRGAPPPTRALTMRASPPPMPGVDLQARRGAPPSSAPAVTLTARPPGSSMARTAAATIYAQRATAPDAGCGGNADASAPPPSQPAVPASAS